MAQNSIGTAWIQIKPTTTGISSAIAKELKQVQTETQDTGKKSGDSFTAGFSAKMGALAGIASSVFSKVTDVVGAQFSAAVSRMDTIKTFPTVMKNLGIGTDQAEQAIQTLSDGLDGLPTTLDDAVSSVQRFTSKNGDVEKSSKMFLALNNALLAGGSSAESQSLALEQISQAYAKGKPDMIEWRSILQNMPAQAKQLATAFGETDLDAFGEKLRKGEITMDDFMNKAMELNENGVDGMASFSEQAGVALDRLDTKMTNVKTSVTKVIAAALAGDDIEKPMNQLIQRVDEILPQITQGLVVSTSAIIGAVPKMIGSLVNGVVAAAPQILDSIVKAFDNLLSGGTELLGIITKAIPVLIKGIRETIPKIINAIRKNTPMIIKGVRDVLMAVVDALPDIAQAIPDIIIGITDALLNQANITMLLEASIELFMALVDALPKIVTAFAEKAPVFIEMIVDLLTSPEFYAEIIDAGVRLFNGLVEAVPRIVGALLKAFGDMFGKLWNLLTEKFGAFAASFGQFLGGVFKNAINGVLQYIEDMINGPIDLINGFVDIINNTFGAIGVNMGHIDRLSLPRLASGGMVGGIGTDTSDSNLVALSKGEYVIKAASARRIGYDNLERMNRTGSQERGEIVNNITINGYNRDPRELAEEISRRIGLSAKRVMA